MRIPRIFTLYCFDVTVSSVLFYRSLYSHPIGERTSDVTQIGFIQNKCKGKKNRRLVLRLHVSCCSLCFIFYELRLKVPIEKHEQ